MTSTEFEQLTSRIIAQMVASGANVLWNDRIPDPDNPNQLRQVDVTIVRQGRKSHIECRNHKAPQDAQWIEELIGRRQSLNAAAMMAVSSSGFTLGAIRKAERYGIFLHELDALSPQEAASWGCHSVVEFGYFGMHPLWLHLVLSRLPTDNLEAIAEALKDRQEYIDAIFNPLRYRFNETYKEFNYPYSFQVAGETHNMELLGRPVVEARVRGTLYLWQHKLLLPTTLAFRRSSHNPGTLAHVESSACAKTEIIKAGAKAYVQIDMSSVPEPEANSMLAGVIDIDLGQPTQIPDFQIIGSPERRIDLYGVYLSVAEAEPKLPATAEV
jgi:hypothetical protein